MLHHNKKYLIPSIYTALIVCALSGSLQAQDAQFPEVEAILVMHTSELAVADKKCDQEWQAYFEAFMAWQTKRGIWNKN